jgi:phosphoglycerate-specific signal transduction histidine kinase
VSDQTAPVVPPPQATKPRPLRLGVRGRLLLAFFGISAFAVLGAAAALYSFGQIGGALGLITQQRVPVALMSQEISRRAERIVAAAPALLTATTPDEKATRSAGISDDVRNMTALLADLRRAGADNAELAAFDGYFDSIRRNLEELDSLMDDRLAAADRKKAELRRALDGVAAIQQLLVPWIAVMEG